LPTETFKHRRSSNNLNQINTANMHAVTGLSLLALAGSVIAAPQHVVYKTEMYTVVVTKTGAAPPAQTMAVNAEANPQKGYGHGHGGHKPKPQTSVVVTTAEQPKTSDKPSNPPSYPAEPPKSTKEPESTPPAYTQQPEKPSSTSAGYGPAPTGGSRNGDYMDTVNTWRAKLSLPDLQYNGTLESNIDTTCTKGNGEMKHELLPGTHGQVLAPAKCDISQFEHVFVGGWLCEMPEKVPGGCAEFSQGWSYKDPKTGEEQKGHAKILTEDGFTQIGCGCVKGIWGCDLA
jgi:uncharacterized protein YkwD